MNFPKEQAKKRLSPPWHQLWGEGGGESLLYLSVGMSAWAMSSFLLSLNSVFVDLDLSPDRKFEWDKTDESMNNERIITYTTVPWCRKRYICKIILTFKEFIFWPETQSPCDLFVPQYCLKRSGCEYM